ncbi:PorP/SprF family type IX secretion system membrane protein [Spongiivirga citrea]|uniref:Type IX secretion system membrane protein PorP/SprF n=1 Tax=Spongiivirga citrea TaxID=1481457 RepID=A0A6M0CI65_9FLAO|nr:PorP/SprF family type IX secretion system membrane protein [Spongiivirga citrea]NER17585.1 type IX secretion system membrane protein PorP/SprF [Spongiivirga citrea]
MTTISKLVFVLTSTLIATSSVIKAQSQEQVSVRSQFIDISNQNLLKYNRSLFHPAFSYVHQETQDLSIYSRIQWVELDNSPKSYFFNYTSRAGERVGTSVSLFQQNVGILTNFGAIVNGAYGIQLDDKVTLSFGVNIPIFRTSLVNNADVTNDPALGNFEESVVVIAQPGINLSIGRFDIGIYGQNLVDYNLKTSESLTNFDEKTFSTHFMYSHPIKSSVQFLDESTLRIVATGLIEGSDASQLGASAILDMPGYGWFQAGYNGFSGFRNEFKGYSVGAGFKMSPELAVGMVYEKGTNVSSLLGPTYEITVAYSFVSKKQKQRGYAPKKRRKPTKTSSTPEKAVVNEVEERVKIDSIQTESAVEANTIDRFRTNKSTKFEKTETLELRPVDGVADGFYLVVNVFAEKQNLNRFLIDLAKKKFQPKYFYDSGRKFYYVYLEKYDNEDEAEKARVSQYGGRYTADSWVLGVLNKL